MISPSTNNIRTRRERTKISAYNYNSCGSSYNNDSNYTNKNADEGTKAEQGTRGFYNEGGRGEKAEYNPLCH